MGICCCCCSSHPGPTPNERRGGGAAYGRQSTARGSDRGTRDTRVSSQYGRVPPTPGADGLCACRICGLRIDPILIEGHEEVCRFNHGQTPNASGTSSTGGAGSHALSAAAQALRDHKDDSDVEGHDEDEICIVCLERLRCFAFLPCGHIATCGACAKQLDTCPLCRQPRQGLCYVPADALSRYQCKHCHEFIAPTLFDGHREVCGLRMRMAQQKEMEEAEAAAKTKGVVEGLPPLTPGPSPSVPPTVGAGPTLGQTEDGLMLPSPALTPQATEHGAAEAPASSVGTSPTTSPGLGPKRAKHILSLCVECGKEDPRLVICLPCGHRVMCGACAKKRTTCPVCLREVKHHIATYE